jgi:hypothetical protein
MFFENYLLIGLKNLTQPFVNSKIIFFSLMNFKIILIDK